MDNEDWPLTSRAIADSERAAGPSAEDLADDEEPVRGNSLLRQLAAEHGCSVEADGRVRA